MHSNKDYTTIYNRDTDKPSESETFRFHFYSDGKYAYINISPWIIEQLRLTDVDQVSQSLTEDGTAIILRRIPRV